MTGISAIPPGLPLLLGALLLPLFGTRLRSLLVLGLGRIFDVRVGTHRGR